MLKFVQNTRISSIFSAPPLWSRLPQPRLPRQRRRASPPVCSGSTLPRQPLDAQASLAEVQQPKVRNTYAHVRKHHVAN